MANKCLLHGNIRNVEEEIIYLQNKFYDYFKVYYRTIKNVDPNTEYQQKYSNLLKCQLTITLSQP